MVSPITGAPGLPAAPISPDILAQLANALFNERPGSGAVPLGVQAPVNIAPPGSPLVSEIQFTSTVNTTMFMASVTIAK